jgi:hypothetical protein
MKGATMLATMQKLGVVPSFSRPSVSNDNPYSEALFKTLKYTPAYPSKPFESLDQARQWVLHFVDWYIAKSVNNDLKSILIVLPNTNGSRPKHCVDNKIKKPSIYSSNSKPYESLLTG